MVEPEHKNFSFIVLNPDGTRRTEFFLEGKFTSISKLIHKCQNEKDSGPLDTVLYDENMNEISEESFQKAVHGQKFVLRIQPKFWDLEMQMKGLEKMKQQNAEMEEFFNLDISSIASVNQSFSLDFGECKTFRDIWKTQQVI